MRVGLDLLFLDPHVSGGRETYVRELLRALGDRVRVTAFLNRESAAAGPGWWTELPERAVVLPGASARNRARWAAGEVLLLGPAAVRAGVDVLHCPANFAPPVVELPLVLTLHDLHFRVQPDTVRTASRLASELLVRAAARRADRVIAPSRSAAEELERELGLTGVTVVTHGLTPPRPAEPAELGEAPVVLSVATNVPHKDLQTALAVGRLVPEARLVLIGAGTEVLGGLGAVEDVEPFYARADAVLLTTRHEGFGFPVIEAMLRGVPVACTDLPVLREVAGSHATFFPAGDAEAGARAVREALGAAPDPRAREHAGGFSWEAAARATMDVYRDALHAHR